MRALPALTLAAALALGAAPLAVLAQEAPAPAAPLAAEPVLPAITVATVAPHLLRDRVIGTGLIGAVEEVQVAPLIEGQPIEALMADVGDRVEGGAVLARLSRSTLELQKAQVTASLASARATIAQVEAQMLEARASADEAARVAERARRLREQGAASQAAADTAGANAVSANARLMVATQSLEAARAQVALAEAQMANIELQLTRTEVRAPFAGEVVARNATIGAIATAAGAPMFTLIRDGALELRADVAEAEVARLAPGQKVALRAVGETVTRSGTVRLVEPSIDPATRLGRVRITLDAPEGLRKGMFADAEILVAEREVLAVPVTAVGASAEGATVMLVREGVVSKVPVRTGIRDGGLVEIVEGLMPGDLVVSKARSFVRPGDRISPVPETATN